MKTLTIRKIAMMLVAMFAVLYIGMIPVSAATVDTSVVDTTKAGATLGETNLNDSTNPAGVPSASIEDLTDRAERKMFSVVTLLQKIGKPFFIVCFLISTVFLIVGLLGRAGAWKGLLGMLASGLLYACVMYAPEIVEWIQLWASAP